MLKNVVLPAPFGPMIDTIERSRHAERHAVDRRQAAEDLRQVVASRGSRAAVGAGPARPVVSGVLMRASPPTVSCRLVRCTSANSAWCRRSGIRPCGRSTIMITSRKPKMPKPELGQVEVQPDLARHVVEHVRDQVRVDERQHERPEHHAPDRPEAAEDDHREHEDRERELELVGVDRVVERAEERAGHAAASRRPARTRAASRARSGCPSRRRRPRPRGSRSRPGRCASRAAGS